MINARKYMVCSASYVGRHPRLGDGQTIPVNLVLKHGYTDFTNDGAYDAEKHVIKEKEREVPWNIKETDVYWNEAAGDIQTTPPE